MQQNFQKNNDLAEQFKNSLSSQRFATYLSETQGNEIDAIMLYQWNSKISQSLYIYLQTWEICLRNRLNNFLVWKYNRDWPYDTKRAVRQLKFSEQTRLKEAIQRQQRERGVLTPSTPMIVADLSAGFWVALLGSGYEVPFVWRYNLARVFPLEPSLDVKTAHTLCEQVLTLRNRVAHHEPVFRMTLEDLHCNLVRMVAAMCAGSALFASSTSRFQDVFKEHPYAR